MSVYAGPADWWTDRTNDGRYHIDTKGIVQTGLVYHLDAGVTQSYSGSGTTWSDLTSNAINATINTVNYSSEFGGTFFTTSNTATFATIGNLAKTIGEIVGFKGDIVFDSSKPNGTPKKLMDSSRLFATGWQPKTHLQAGISLAYADFLTKHSTKNN
ncbi:MAG: hypothetical protein EBQ97_00680 [Bacteroidetes bacterium]|nr:hypothetical protein [Bacteroidota bacterium]